MYVFLTKNEWGNYRLTKAYVVKMHKDVYICCMSPKKRVRMETFLRHQWNVKQLQNYTAVFLSKEYLVSSIMYSTFLVRNTNKYKELNFRKSTTPFCA